MWTVFLAFLIGIVVGGLVNQLGSDLPGRGRPTAPHCPYCGSQRPWWQWLGVLAYATGHPQCPSCGARVRFSRPLVEIALGFVYGYLCLAPGPSAQSLFYALYTAILALVFVSDLEHGLIPNTVTYPAVVLGVAGSFFVSSVNLRTALIGGAIGFVFFFVAAVVGRALFGPGALGGGDVKLAAFVGVITGYPLVIEAIVLTILIGAAVSLFLVISRIRGLRDHVPYGPFLVLGALITLLWGYPIAVWFLA